MSKLISLLVVAAACAAVWFWVLRPVLVPESTGAGLAPIVVGQQTGKAAVQRQDAALRAAVSRQADVFLRRWQRRDYAGMYALLDQSSRRHITKARFVQRYGEIGAEATIAGISY